MTVRILTGDCRDKLAELPAESAHCVVTSPPYWGLRDYGVDGQLGLEATPEKYVLNLVEIFQQVRRVLRNDGTLWLNLGDSYASQGGPEPAQTKWKIDGASNTQNAGKSRNPSSGLKPKDLVGIPWRVALALQADGWWLRSDIIWHKTNCMPESVTDRPTKAHEYIFLLTKSARYFYDADMIREDFADDRMGNPGKYRKTSAFERKTCNDRQDLGIINNGGGWNRGTQLGGRNKRTVWTIPTHPFPEAHFASFPPALVEPCIKAGCPEGGTVLDPFGGAGTTGLVADRLGRDAILIELNPTYAEMAERRIVGEAPMFVDVVRV